ncbi:MAG: hypothetical protein CM1200mP2_02330 [Planctomycetaceae bacterium]|nr:MAG: hypothetical protein CM1200mP2_02330 [Planctomycetaceae bacterium]
MPDRRAPSNGDDRSHRDHPPENLQAARETSTPNRSRQPPARLSNHWPWNWGGTAGPGPGPSLIERIGNVREQVAGNWVSCCRMSSSATTCHCHRTVTGSRSGAHGSPMATCTRAHPETIHRLLEHFGRWSGTRRRIADSPAGSPPGRSPHRAGVTVGGGTRPRGRSHVAAAPCAGQPAGRPGFPIRDLETILETLGDLGNSITNPPVDRAGPSPAGPGHLPATPRQRTPSPGRHLDPLLEETIEAHCRFADGGLEARCHPGCLNAGGGPRREVPEAVSR